MPIDKSMENPKNSVMGICKKYIRFASLKYSRVMNGNSNSKKSRLSIIVHCPMVNGVHRLST